MNGTTDGYAQAGALLGCVMSALVFLIGIGAGPASLDNRDCC